MSGDVEVQYPSAIMTDNEEAVEQAKGHYWDGEEVHRGNRFAMASQKYEPSFRRLRSAWSASHPTGNGSLGNIESEHQEFTVNSRRSPRQVLDDHSED